MGSLTTLVRTPPAAPKIPPTTTPTAAPGTPPPNGSRNSPPIAPTYPPLTAPTRAPVPILQKSLELYLFRYSLRALSASAFFLAKHAALALSKACSTGDLGFCGVG